MAMIADSLRWFLKDLHGPENVRVKMEGTKNCSLQVGRKDVSGMVHIDTHHIVLVDSLPTTVATSLLDCEDGEGEAANDDDGDEVAGAGVSLLD